MPSPKSANLRHLDYEWITGNPEVEPRQQFLAARRLPTFAVWPQLALLRCS